MRHDIHRPTDCLPGQNDLFDAPSPSGAKAGAWKELFAGTPEADELIGKLKAIDNPQPKKCELCGRETHVRFCSADCYVRSKLR